MGTLEGTLKNEFVIQWRRLKRPWCSKTTCIRRDYDEKTQRFQMSASKGKSQGQAIWTAALIGGEPLLKQPPPGYRSRSGAFPQARCKGTGFVWLPFSSFVSLLLQSFLPWVCRRGVDSSVFFLSFFFFVLCRPAGSWYDMVSMCQSCKKGLSRCLNNCSIVFCFIQWKIL